MCTIPTECLEAREAASARVDEELSELGSLRLDRHLRACEPCFAYAADIGSVAIALRTADLQQPSATLFVSSSAVGRRRGRARAAGVALAVAAGAASFTLAGLFGSPPGAAPAAVAAGDARSARADSAEQHLLAFVQTALLSRQGRMEAV